MKPKNDFKNTRGVVCTTSEVGTQGGGEEGYRSITEIWRIGMFRGEAFVVRRLVRRGEVGGQQGSGSCLRQERRGRSEEAKDFFKPTKGATWGRQSSIVVVEVTLWEMAGE